MFAKLDDIGRARTIVADLAKPQPIRNVRLFAYRRPTAGTPGSAFDVERMTVSVSELYDPMFVSQSMVGTVLGNGGSFQAQATFRIK